MLKIVHPSSGRPYCDSFGVQMTRVRIVDAWRSHGTLQRQPVLNFGSIVMKIDQFLRTAEEGGRRSRVLIYKQNLNYIKYPR